jgi:guanosine-3',5'-bis(diphosphate) 3'-pyrophosphohydrolase
MSEIWQKAASFAARAHGEQFRKDNETPYIAHPFRVAMTVLDIFKVDDSNILAAALLHDTIEDTTTDYDEVHEEFSPAIASLVAALTKDMRLPEDRREKEYMIQLKEAPWQARLIKLADVYDNLADSPSASMEKSSIRKAKEVLHLADTGEPEMVRAAGQLKKLIRKYETSGVTET